MKKFILAAVGASLLTTPVFAASFQAHGPNDRGRIEQKHRPEIRRDAYRPGKVQFRQSWKRGDRFDARRAYNYRVIGNPRVYRLHDAPRGYRWVQSGNDAVLVGIATGIIASVMANVIR
ncbi:RcnB family protein [Rhizorhabdus histidinilytica]|uniref:RcnB family protein n=1 Tax=Rhizorhabdus histidinilytica TaxID=439228 RepID=UPI00063EE793|nr:RcnB family protein [Sphingomonas sp. Y57]